VIAKNKIWGGGLNLQELRGYSFCSLTGRHKAFDEPDMGDNRTVDHPVDYYWILGTRHIIVNRNIYIFRFTVAAYTGLDQNQSRIHGIDGSCEFWRLL